MELVSYIDAIVSNFTSQQCLFADIDENTFRSRVKAISTEISDEYIAEIYERLVANETLDKRALTPISVSSSIKIVGLTKKFSASSTPHQRLELICFLIFLSERVLTFNRQVLEIIKVISSILLTREEDFKILCELAYTKKYPIISDPSFTYIVSEPVSLEILLTNSRILVHPKDRIIYSIYRFHTYPDYYALWWRELNTKGKYSNQLKVLTYELLQKELEDENRIVQQNFNEPETGDRKSRIEFPGNEFEPRILLDSSKGLLKISRASMPHSAFDFYQPIIRWIDSMKTSKPAQFSMHINLDFFDTPSSKMLLETMRKTLELEAYQIPVSFYWHTEQDDIDMLEAGKEYALLLGKNFNFLSDPDKFQQENL